jgi:hypothetical protein
MSYIFIGLMELGMGLYVIVLAGSLMVWFLLKVVNMFFGWR